MYVVVGRTNSLCWHTLCARSFGSVGVDEQVDLVLATTQVSARTARRGAQKVPSARLNCETKTEVAVCAGVVFVVALEVVVETVVIGVGLLSQ